MSVILGGDWLFFAAMKPVTFLLSNVTLPVGLISYFTLPPPSFTCCLMICPTFPFVSPFRNHFSPPPPPPPSLSLCLHRQTMNLNDISIEPCFSFAVVPGRRYQKPPCRALHSNKPSCDHGSLLSCSLQGCRRQLHFPVLFFVVLFFCCVNKVLKSFSCLHENLKAWCTLH